LDFDEICSLSILLTQTSGLNLGTDTEHILDTVDIVSLPAGHKCYYPVITGHLQ